MYSRESELLIQNPSQELLKAALKTIPDPVNVGTIVFAANGVAPFDGLKYSEGDRCQKYINECLEHKITPFTHLTLQYNANRGQFLQHVPVGDSGLIQFYSQSTPEHYSAAIKALLSGSKIHLLTYDTTEYVEGRSAFRLLQNEIIDLLASHNYKLQEGRVEIGHYDSHLSFRTGSEKGRLRLNQASSVMDEFLLPAHLSDWFIDLAQKHHTVAEVPSHSLS